MSTNAPDSNNQHETPQEREVDAPHVEYPDGTTPSQAEQERHEKHVKAGQKGGEAIKKEIAATKH